MTPDTRAAEQAIRDMPFDRLRDFQAYLQGYMVAAARECPASPVAVELAAAVAGFAAVVPA